MGFQSPARAGHGQRNFNRLRLGARASLVLIHETKRCLIDDISTSGVRLRIAYALHPGTTAQLTFHELRVYATVMWCHNGECGLRFETPLDLEDMQGMLWITENRELYARICNEAHALSWSEGIGD